MFVAFEQIFRDSLYLIMANVKVNQMINTGKKVKSTRLLVATRVFCLRKKPTRISPVIATLASKVERLPKMVSKTTSEQELQMIVRPEVAIPKPKNTQRQ